MRQVRTLQLRDEVKVETGIAEDYLLQCLLSFGEGHEGRTSVFY
ncbi:hypothetical protein [Paenibacillus sp. BJ-4]|nr:hypothetical protein [Paenibacillus sp. BJ-4]